MLMDEYFSAMKNVLTKAENTQREAILAAADEIANRLEKGGAWQNFCHYVQRAGIWLRYLQNSPG